MNGIRTMMPIAYAIGACGLKRPWMPPSTRKIDWMMLIVFAVLLFASIDSLRGRAAAAGRALV